MNLNSGGEKEFRESKKFDHRPQRWLVVNGIDWFLLGFDLVGEKKGKKEKKKKINSKTRWANTFCDDRSHLQTFRDFFKF